METISQVLFWVANSLLIPDILLLLLLFIRALLLVGGIYNQYMAKRKNDKRLNDLIKNLTPDKVDDLRKALPAKDNSLYIRYLRDLLTNPASQDYADYLISNFENDAEKDVILSKLLTKIGPRTGSDRHADRHEPGARGTLDGRHRRYVLQYAGRIRHDGRGPRDQRRGPGIPAIQAALVCQGCQ